MFRSFALGGVTCLCLADVCFGGTTHDPGEALPLWQTVISDISCEPTRLFRAKGMANNDTNASWYLRSTDRVYTDIPVNVPGDVLTDLMKAGVIGDPYYNRNWLTQRRVWMGPINGNRNPLELEQRTRTWVYSTTFILADYFHNTTRQTLLVMEGIKMGASLTLNGEPFGNVTDQFLRYILPLPVQALKKGLQLSSTQTRHKLEVTFDPTISTRGRFMACSGGWDWAPYSRAGDERGSRVLTFGIVQPMYLVEVEQVYIKDVVPLVYYNHDIHHDVRQLPTVDFLVRVHVTLCALVDYSEDRGFLLAQSDFTDGITRILLPAMSMGSEEVVTIELVASKDRIELWWPNGMGKQPLYRLQVAIQTSDGYQSPWISRRIGFRTVALVTANDTLVEDETGEGSGTHGMLFRVNGVAVASRGANVIPMDQLEGRWTEEAHSLMVRSAAEMGMNMIRVWGGGIVFPSSFYDACDEQGILLYHDMMFVEEQNHGALALPIVEDELEHIVRNIAHHPSIALYSGCNECLYFNGTIDVYESFVLETVAAIDDTRPIWPTSPSAGGWETGVWTRDGRPNGNSLKARTKASKHDLEAHGPYGHGASLSFPSVNQIPAEANYTAQLPPWFPDGPVGLEHPNTFISEFGASVFSSFESMSIALPQKAWSLHGGAPPATCQHVRGQVYVCNGTNPMAERNYACDNHITAYFGNASLDDVGCRSFQKQLYLCMISQSLWMKGQIETKRASNSFGSLIWQLNENFPTGGWGILEYGPDRMDGQQIGGRWKPLAYMLRDSLFRDVFAACGQEYCYVRNDGTRERQVAVIVEAWNLRQNDIVLSQSWDSHLDAGPGSMLRFHLPKSVQAIGDVALFRVVERNSGIILMHDSAFLWRPPKLMPSLGIPVKLTVRVKRTTKQNASIQLQSNRLALYVVLSSPARGRFSTNAFHLRPNTPIEILFEPVTAGETIDTDLLMSSLRIEHLGTYAPQALSIESQKSPLAAVSSFSLLVSSALLRLKSIFGQLWPISPFRIFEFQCCQ